MYPRLGRRTALVAAGALVIGLAACDSSGSDAKGNRAGAMDGYGVGVPFKATESVSFPILYNNHPNYSLKNEWLFWSELTKRTNVKLEPVAVPLSDYNQKRGLLIGAGDAPLVIPKTYHPAEEAFVSSGAILPVSDYLDLMPNFKDKVAKWKLEPELGTLRQADGKFYLLPGVHEVPWTEYSIAIRTDILDKLGLKAPTTWDELYTVLTAMKKAHPDLYPFSDRYKGDGLLSIVAPSYGTKAGWGYQHTSWDPTTGRYVYTGAMPQYKQMVEYLNKLVTEKLLDPESFTQNDDQAKQKLANGKSFVISTNAQELVNTYRPDLAKTIPDATIVKLPLPAGPAGDVNPGSRLENGIMISSKAKYNKNFVAMMQFVDWLWYSDEGQQFAKWGVEGVTYTRDASGPHLASDVDMVRLNPSASKHLQKDFGFSNGVFTYGGSRELVQSFFSGEEKEIQKAMATRKQAPIDPPKPFTDQEREQATLWEAALKDHVTRTTLTFILGQRPLSEWDGYVKELEGKNMTQYTDLVNRAYDRYKAKS